MQVSTLDTQQSQVEEPNNSPEEKQRKHQQPRPKPQQNSKTIHCLPYHQGLSESTQRSCKKYGIQAHLKGGPTIKNLLLAPKDKDSILKKVESYIDINVTGWIVMKNT